MRCLPLYSKVTAAPYIKRNPAANSRESSGKPGIQCVKAVIGTLPPSCVSTCRLKVTSSKWWNYGKVLGITIRIADLRRCIRVRVRVVLLMHFPQKERNPQMKEVMCTWFLQHTDRYRCVANWLRCFISHDSAHGVVLWIWEVQWRLCSLGWWLDNKNHRTWKSWLVVQDERIITSPGLCTF